MVCFVALKVNIRMIYFQVSRNCLLHKWIAPHEKFVDRKLAKNAYDQLG